jgi:hypothetical protein
MDQVSIVGAGPVGLALSIQLIRQGFKVTVYEKRPDFTRRQQVHLKPDRLRVFGIPFPEVVELGQLQTQLKEKAESLGVNFTQDEVQSLTGLAGKVVLATGSKCSLRDQIFGSVVHLTEPKLVVLCRYESMNKPIVLKDITEWYPTLKILEGVATEQIKKKRVSLLWEAPDDRDEVIRDRLRFWVNIRRDSIVLGSLSFSSYRSTLYKSSSFAKKVGNQSVFLVGDCAIGVPYFKSLQKGLENLSCFIFSIPQYDEEMKKRSSVITSSSLVQTLSYSFLSTYLQISRALPLQLNYWNEDTVQQLSQKEVKGLEISFL